MDFRIKKFLRLSFMIPDGAEKKEITMGTLEANMKAMIFVLPVFILFGVPFYLLWNENFSFDPFLSLSHHFVLIILILIAGSILHEFIHGLFWSFYLKDGFKSIKIGMMWKFLTPYCHSKELLKVKHYMLGTLMPGVILGFLPSLVALLTGNFGLLAFGVFFTIGAGGDFLTLWMLRKENKNNFVEDHPSKVGCCVYVVN